MRKLILTLLYFFYILTSNSWGQCAPGEVEITINTSGGSFPGEKWVNITTGPNGTGTVLWAQGNGTIGNGSGLLTNQNVCVLDGVTYYFNCYDQYDDSWDGSTYIIDVAGTVIANNGGASPTDGVDTDGSSAWQAIAAELETSEAFVAGAPVSFPTDVCEDDAVINMLAPQSYSATSGKAGLAVILVTDNQASQTTFTMFDRNWDAMYDETNFPGAPGSLANNTVYVLYNNECFNVGDNAGIPYWLDLNDSGGNGLDGSTGAGLYIYYYAADAMEVINNNANYISPGGSFSSFYTGATNKRTSIVSFTGGFVQPTLPPPSSFEYISAGTWSGTGVANVGTSSKTYFGGFTGLARTITVPSGPGIFDPTIPAVGPNATQTYTYNSVYGSAGPASCSAETTTITEVDVHARPTILPVLNQTCAGATYDVTVDVDLGTYNVSVDQDGITAFTVTGSGGSFSTSSLTGTGVTQVTISNIPIGNTWSLNVNDVSGISCGLTGTNGNCNTVLPITLLKFEANCSQGIIKIDWTTSSEINNDYFIIEKSVDAVNFESVGTVSGNGNSSSIVNYTLIDDGSIEGVAYYRLKQIDFDGAFEYLGIITANCEKNERLYIYPNPFENKLTIQLFASSQSPISVEIHDYLGRIVSSEIVPLGATIYQLNLENNLNKGIYFIKIYLKDEIMLSKKIMKL